MEIKRVGGEAESDRLFCFVCATRSASFFTFRAAEMPLHSGYVSGIAVCTSCMNQMTHNALSDWDGGGDAAHASTR